MSFRNIESEKDEIMEAKRLSQEVFAIPHNENFIVYAPLQGTAILCNASMIHFLQHLYSGDDTLLHIPEYAKVIEHLTKSRLLLDSEESEKETALLISEPVTDTFLPTRVTFLVTTNCNLRCVYCYASAGDNHITIPFDICKASIDLIINNCLKLNVPDCHVAFHGGGEPTTAFSLIRQCVEYAREKGDQYGIQSTFSIVTNGVLNDSQIEWLAANMYGISVSLDGPPDIQNRQRPMINGQGSFTQVFNTIKKLEQLNAHPFIRATITNENVGRMREISRFFSENFETSEFQLEPVAVCGRCNTTGYKEPMVEEFVNGVEAAVEEAAKYGKKAVCSAALDTFPNVMEAYCGVAAPNFAITPDGIVTSCYEVSLSDDPKGKIFYYGHYEREMSQFVFDDDVIKRLRSLVVQNIQRCKDCFSRWQCAGDCPVRTTWNSPLSKNNSDSNFRCQTTRELVKRRLVRFLEKEILDVN